MAEVIVIEGNARALPLEGGSVNMCVTSPPYFGLRDYGVLGQLGLESTPEEYVARMVEVFREVRRVLRDDGTLWLNIGDSYAGSGKGLGDIKSNNRSNGASRGVRIGSVHGDSGHTSGVTPPPGYKSKDLIGIPWMLALALRGDGWYLRSDIIWHKPNPMPENVTDRPTKSHEYIFLLSKSRKYYYDAEAVSEPVAASTVARLAQKAVPPRFGGAKYGASDDPHHQTKSGKEYQLKPRRNKRSVWSVATRPSKEAHFATFPPALIEPCILAGCPQGGTVLDPFGGSGTTGLVAKAHGRNAILVELNPAYAAMARRRLA